MPWNRRRVFVTGHTGFKGSWLSLWLQSQGAIVRGYALAPDRAPSLFEAAEVASGMYSIYGDIRDRERLQKAMQAFRPEIVLHLAAQPLVRLSYAQPLETYDVNVMGTAHLLEAVRATPGVRAVVVVTTDKCYENREWVWAYRESDQLGGYDPYSSSKAAAELVTASYRSSFFAPERYAEHGVAVATVRAGNVIGGGDWAPDRLIPDMVRAMHAGTPVRIRHPEAVRPWQHVLEPLRGYLMLAEALYEHGPAYGEAWNFGPRDEALPVRALVERMTTLWNELGRPVARWEHEQSQRVHEAHLLRLDWSKAAHRLGWQPVLSINQALQSTVAWYAAWAEQGAMRAFTLEQIRAYEELSIKPGSGERAHSNDLREERVWAEQKS